MVVICETVDTAADSFANFNLVPPIELDRLNHDRFFSKLHHPPPDFASAPVASAAENASHTESAYT